MRFHIIPPFHTFANMLSSGCPFTQKAILWCKMMKLENTDFNHHIMWYGCPYEADIKCDELIDILSKEEIESVYGVNAPAHGKSGVVGDLVYAKFNKRIIIELRKRLQPFDFILCFYGAGAADIVNVYNKSKAIVVEPGIGNYHIPLPGAIHAYESYACFYFNHGKINKEVPSWKDMVVPPCFDTDYFDFSEKPGSYFLFIGRIIASKGINIAIDLAIRHNFELRIAGKVPDDDSVDMSKLPPNVKYVGYVSGRERVELFKNAKALIMPTLYIEPFGYTMMESLMCGTPVISTDWGSFTEHITDGYNGYRCRQLVDFDHAIENIEKIDRYNCRMYSMKFNLANSKIKNDKFYAGLLRDHIKLS